MGATHHSHTFLLLLINSGDRSLTIRLHPIKSKICVKCEAFKHRDGFVILEDVTIGVCDTCGNRYYSADILHAVHAVAIGAKAPEMNKSQLLI